MSGVNLSVIIIISFVCHGRQFACFIRLVWQIRVQFFQLAGQFTCFIRLAGQIMIQSVYLGVMREHCLPLDSSLKRSLPSGILPHILKFTPEMTSY